MGGDEGRPSVLARNSNTTMCCYLQRCHSENVPILLTTRGSLQVRRNAMYLDPWGYTQSLLRATS